MSILTRIKQTDWVNLAAAKMLSVDPKFLNYRLSMSREDMLQELQIPKEEYAKFSAHRSFMLKSLLVDKAAPDPQPGTLSDFLQQARTEAKEIRKIISNDFKYTPYDSHIKQAISCIEDGHLLSAVTYLYYAFYVHLYGVREKTKRISEKPSQLV